MRAKLAIVIVAAHFAGCTSISSTLLNRMDNDMFAGNSNGSLKFHNNARPFKGIPITVNVPTHVDVRITEKVRLYAHNDSVDIVKTPHRHLGVDADMVYTDKVFTVDPKRPGAGTLNYTLDFGTDGEQYFKAIKSKITDDTLQDVTTAIRTVMSAFSPTAGDSVSRTLTDDDKGSGVFTETRTVAWKRFDVDAPDFEHQMSAFVEQHLNCCNSCLLNSSPLSGTADHRFDPAPQPAPQPAAQPAPTFLNY